MQFKDHNRNSFPPTFLAFQRIFYIYIYIRVDETSSVPCFYCSHPTLVEDYVTADLNNSGVNRYEPRSKILEVRSEDLLVIPCITSLMLMLLR